MFMSSLLLMLCILIIVFTPLSTQSCFFFPSSRSIPSTQVKLFSYQRPAISICHRTPIVRFLVIYETVSGVGALVMAPELLLTDWFRMSSFVGKCPFASCSLTSDNALFMQNFRVCFSLFILVSSSSHASLLLHSIVQFPRPTSSSSKRRWVYIPRPVSCKIQYVLTEGHK